MSKTRVLVVSGAAGTRRLMAEALAADSGLEVVGPAASGGAAVALAQHAPDLVVVDLDADGPMSLAAVLSAAPRPPVVVFSQVLPRAAPAALEAISQGAAAFATTYGTAAGDPVSAAREALVARVKKVVARRPADSRPRPALSGVLPPPPVDVLAVGASTGGPDALAEFLSALSAGCPVPVVIVQHMPPVFTRMLAERLSAQTGLPVREAIEGAALLPGDVWLAPGDHHLTVTRDRDGVRLGLHQGPPENSCRPAVDVLFRSVAEAYGPGALGTVLTGMGRDGLLGCERVRESGGRVLVQDEASSVVWGMPSFVARAGLADAVLPLADLGPEVARRLSRGRRSVRG